MYYVYMYMYTTYTSGSSKCKIVGTCQMKQVTPDPDGCDFHWDILKGRILICFFEMVIYTYFDAYTYTFCGYFILPNTAAGEIQAICPQPIKQ